MKVVDLEAWLFHRPLDAPFQPSWVPGYTSTTNSAVIYRLRTDEGLEGIAGGVAFADEARGPVNLLRAYLLGLDLEDIEEVHSRLKTASRTLGIRAWFVEVAFWDLRGKAEGRSIGQLLGAERDRVRAYASTGELRSPGLAAEHAREVLERGFPGIKIRTRHATVEEDLEMVEAVRETIGDGIALMCDANQAWRVDTFAKGPLWDLDRAAEAARGMEEFGVVWLEEPLDMYDLAGYAELRRRTATPIAAGELHGDPGLVELLMEAEGVDVVQPDLVFTGGVTGVWGLVQKAHSRGLSFAPHAWSNGLGLAANLQVAAAAPNCDWLEFPYDPPGWVPE
ncbi:MAG: mandelate racemase/muconate lactonizing enzyme family protein, partial [Actinomycetota bacterium]